MAEASRNLVLSIDAFNTNWQATAKRHSLDLSAPKIDEFDRILDSYGDTRNEYGAIIVIVVFLLTCLYYSLYHKVRSTKII